MVKTRKMQKDAKEQPIIGKFQGLAHKRWSEKSMMKQLDVQKREAASAKAREVWKLRHPAILSFVQVGLESLEGLPNLPMLSCLNLSDNKLTGGLEVLADKCPDLAYIILSGNSLKDIDVLKPLAKMDKLLDLELCNTGLDDLPDYRMKVFEMLPHLKHLDGGGLDDTDESGEDDESSSEDISMDGLSDDSTDDDEEIKRQRSTYLKSPAAKTKDNSSAEAKKNEEAADDENVKPDQARGVKRQHKDENKTDAEPEIKSS